MIGAHTNTYTRKKDVERIKLWKEVEERRQREHKRVGNATVAKT